MRKCESVMALGFTKEQVTEAIEGSAGIVSTIAKRLNCSWHTADKYVNRWECTRQAYANEEEHALDLAETKLLKLINAEDGTMIRYYLSTKGKRRGYVERRQAEVTGKDGGPIRTIILDVARDADDDPV